MKLKNNFRYMEIFTLSLLIISLNFGEYIQVAGLSCSWYFAIWLLLLNILYLCSHKGDIVGQDSKHRLILVFVLICVIISALQIVWIKDYNLWKQGLLSNSVNLFLCLEIGICVLTEKSIVFLMKSIVLSLIISVVTGIYEIVTGIHFIYESVSIWDQDSVRTFFGNPNDCATWILLCLFITTLYLGITHKSAVYYLLTWMPTIYVIYHTNSRAARLSLIVCLVFIGVGFGINYFYKNNKSKVKIVFYMIVVVVLFISTMLLVNIDLEMLIRNLISEGNVESDLFRVEITKKNLQVIIHNFLLGAGVNHTTYFLGINPHNFLLELFGDYGVIVFGFIVYILYKIFTRIFDEDYDMNYQVICFAFVPAFLVISISSSSMNRLRMTWIALIIFYLLDKKREE